jgi:hypothetical protein
MPPEKPRKTRSLQKAERNVCECKNALVLVKRDCQWLCQQQEKGFHVHSMDKTMANVKKRTKPCARCKAALKEEQKRVKTTERNYKTWKEWRTRLYTKLKNGAPMDTPEKKTKKETVSEPEADSSDTDDKEKEEKKTKKEAVSEPEADSSDTDDEEKEKTKKKKKKKK